MGYINSHVKEAGIGLGFGDLDVEVMNRTGGTREIGDVVMFDVTQSQAEVSGSSTKLQYGSKTSIWANVVPPATAQIDYGLFAVVTRGGADNTQIRVKVSGITPTKVSATTATTATIGAAGIVLNASHALGVIAASPSDKPIGIILEAAGTTATVLKSTLIDGINGWL